MSPSEAESCALSLVIDAPDSAVAGGQFDYVLRYYNESSTDFDTGTLSLTLPSGLSVVDVGLARPVVKRLAGLGSPCLQAARLTAGVVSKASP